MNARLYNGLKRATDITVALLSLIAFSPLFLVCYIAIRSEDGGPAFFAQERIGKGGRPFQILKFRSMRGDAEKDGIALCPHEDDERGQNGSFTSTKS